MAGLPRLTAVGWKAALDKHMKQSIAGSNEVSGEDCDLAPLDVRCVINITASPAGLPRPNENSQ